MNQVIKLSAPATREFWEIPVLFEDEHLLALNKPGQLLTSPDRYDLQRPNLMQLLHAGIERGAPWATARGLSYLMNAHRLDFEASGVLLLARTKATLITLADQFGSGKPVQTYVALVSGTPVEGEFSVDAKLAAHPVDAGKVHVDERRGKRAHTRFTVLEKFQGYTLLQCQPLIGRIHQIRVHLRHLGLPVVGDTLYGGQTLLLSRLKLQYRLKPNRTERPLISCVALHGEELTLPHPVTGESTSIKAPWPKDLTVAVNYLRRYALA